MAQTILYVYNDWIIRGNARWEGLRICFCWPSAYAAGDFQSDSIVCPESGGGGGGRLRLLFQDERLEFPTGQSVSLSANDIKSIVINARLITLVAMATQLIICTYYYAHANLGAGAACVFAPTEQVGLREHSPNLLAMWELGSESQSHPLMRVRAMRFSPYPSFLNCADYRRNCCSTTTCWWE